MSCRCIRGQDSHFTFRKEKKKIRNKEVGLQESAEGGGSPLPFSLSPLSVEFLSPSQSDQEALWHFKRHRLAWRGGFVGNTRKLETPGRADLHLMGACNYVAKPLCGA